jgi:hypothetical protein
MNLIVNDRTQFPHLAVVLVVMAVMSATLLRWTKRQGGGSATRPSACHFIRCG